MVADQARAEVTVRTVGETAELKRRIAAAVHAVPGVRIAEIRETPAVQLGSLPGFETTIVKYTTDIPRLGAWGEPFLLGPGSIHVAHTPRRGSPNGTFWTRRGTKGDGPAAAGPLKGRQAARPIAQTIFPMSPTIFLMGREIFFNAKTVFPMGCEIFLMGLRIFPMGSVIFTMGCEIFPMEKSFSPMGSEIFPAS